MALDLIGFHIALVGIVILFFIAYKLDTKAVIHCNLKLKKKRKKLK